MAKLPPKHVCSLTAKDRTSPFSSALSPHFQTLVIAILLLWTRKPFFGRSLAQKKREMGLISNRVDEKGLKPGDHIYSWRTAYIYAHHGIYVGDDKVIHFTRRGQEAGTGTVLDGLVWSSLPAPALVRCSTCSPPEKGHHGVVSSCLNCFLAGGVLYRYEYAVSRALFLASVRGGTCTLAASDPVGIVVHRANHLLNNGFRRYDTFKNNCEDFAIYCKTGLLVLDERTMGQSGQADSLVSGLNALVSSVQLKLFTTTDVSTMGIIDEEDCLHQA